MTKFDLYVESILQEGAKSKEEIFSNKRFNISKFKDSLETAKESLRKLASKGWIGNLNSQNIEVMFDKVIEDLGEEPISYIDMINSIDRSLSSFEETPLSNLKTNRSLRGKWLRQFRTMFEKSNNIQTVEDKPTEVSTRMISRLAQSKAQTAKKSQSDLSRKQEAIINFVQQGVNDEIQYDELIQFARKVAGTEYAGEPSGTADDAESLINSLMPKYLTKEGDMVKAVEQNQEDSPEEIALLPDEEDLTWIADDDVSDIEGAMAEREKSDLYRSQFD
jgi:hypothetical protein